MTSSLFVALLAAVLMMSSSAFFVSPLARISQKVPTTSTSLHGIMDALNKAMANEANLPPVQNPGLSKEAELVEVEFLPSKKKTTAILGQKFKLLAQQAKVQIPYSCERGSNSSNLCSFHNSFICSLTHSLCSFISI